jgi:hypothetical protein
MRTRRIVQIVAAIAALAVAVAAASGQDRDSKRMSDRLTRKDKGEGGVSVVVLFLAPEYLRVARLAERRLYDTDVSLAFAVTLDAHSGDLGSLDITKLASLRDAQGREQAPSGWEDTSRGPHHREGVLLFPRLDANGNPVLRDDADVMEVVIRDVARVKERLFRWELPIRLP